MALNKTIDKIKKKNRYIYIKLRSDENEYKFHPEICALFQFHQEKTFSEERWQEIINTNNEKLAMQTTLELITRREHSRGEINSKLRLRGYSQEIIDKVIETCLQLQLLDDKKFTEIYVKELRNKGLGINRIKIQLLKKQINNDIIKTILNDKTVSDEQFQQAEKVLKRKLQTLKREKDPRKRKHKALRFMYYRGYPTEIVSHLLEKLDL